MLGEKVVGLPWESLSLLADEVVCRMPSLKFTAAHMHMVGGCKEDFLKLSLKV